MTRTAMIDLDDVFVLYPVLDRQVAALRGLSLRVSAGERVVVTGPSGSGKSTLVSLVTGRVRPSAGTAVVLDHDLTNASARAIAALQRTGVGVVTQQMSANLLPELTGRQNAAMQSRLAGASVDDSNRLASTMLDRLGVGHLADRRLGTISAGEAQRVALAAALAHRPRVIVADEPTGALDHYNANIVFELLSELSDELDAALLVVSHDPGAGRIGHRVLEIRDGRLGAERIADDLTTRLVVDNRGWVRLPESDRIRAGIVDRVVVAGSNRWDPSDVERRPVVELCPPGGPVDAPQVDTPTVEAPADAPQVLALHDVTRSIGTVRILAPTSLVVRAGELLIVAGRSGSGKTTLLGILGAFGIPTEGSVARSDDLSVAVGTSTPGFAETMTVRQNIVLACTVRGSNVDDALTASIDESLAAVGMLELAERPVSTLSGGERQRASIVRAVSSGARLVLLDEPTSQLDQGLARRVSAFLLHCARQGHAIVCASHEPELIAAADRVHSLS
ncbi:MAG: transporter related [Acidimicrobiales bacterium]|nr:transporter related [Acidimicrobiales bacterium]